MARETALGMATLVSMTASTACEHAAVCALPDLPVLSDGVVTLRPWGARDAGFLVTASRDAAIQRYSLSTSRPLHVPEAHAHLRDDRSYRLTTDDTARPAGSLVIAEASSDIPLGQCGIDGWSADDAAQIGYWLAPDARGHGLATRAVLLLTVWLFGLGARRVFLTVVEDNHASIHVAQRAGFTLEGPTGEQHTWEGRGYEELSFAVTHEDWKRRPGP